MADSPLYQNFTRGRSMKEDRPYMPWYIKDWLASEDRPRMTYEARGIYRELLDYAWLHRGIPSDKSIISDWLGISERKFSLNWTQMSSCWYLDGGRYYNAKQERVRAELDEFRENKRAAGRKGWQKRASAQALVDSASSRPTPAPPHVLIAEPMQDAGPAPILLKPSSSSSSSSSKEEEEKTPPLPPPPPPRSKPLMMSAVEFAKRAAFNAFVGSRLQVPTRLHGDLRRKLGGADAESRLQAWYLAVDEEIERTGETIPDVFPWLDKRFQAWASDQAFLSEVEKFRPKGA